MNRKSSCGYATHFLLFYIKIFKITKCKKKVYGSLRNNTNYCFYDQN
jgi:hypothetical protein